MNILLIGHGAREHVIAETFRKNKEVKLFSFMKSKNPRIAALSKKILVGSYSDLNEISKFAKNNYVDLAFIGPEDPLNNGVVDALKDIEVESVGPTKSMTRLESSKSFTRNLLEKHQIDGNIKFTVLSKDNLDELRSFLNDIDQAVVKPDGLTGGKGVRVQGDHFNTKEEAFEYCEEVLETHELVVVEEKLDGEEFSLQCLTDGKTVVPTPVAQDHKRAYDGDKGPNTGGMGSYSCENHLLPFLNKDHVDKALEITKKVSEAIYKETGQFYKGVMYGGFILTKDGVKLIEYNARFGDPEAMNVLPLLRTDFASICQAIILQKLNQVNIDFEKKATVCKYAVPDGYPGNPVKDEKITIGPGKAKVYYASVEEKEDGLYMTGSRAIAFLGIGNSLEDAEKIAEESICSAKGKIFHRKDIGTKALIEKRVKQVYDQQILGKGVNN